MIELTKEELAPGILVIRNAINNSDKLLNQALSEKSLWESSGVLTHDGIKNIDKNVRNVDTLDISPTLNNDVIWFSLSQKIWQYGDMYGKKYNVPFSAMESAQMLRYEIHDGHYKEHYDSSRHSPRVFSAVLYLNDVFEGGETYFPKFDISIRPEKNKLVLFPANYIYVHSAKPPKSNKKFCVVTWFTP